MTNDLVRGIFNLLYWTKALTYNETAKSRSACFEAKCTHVHIQATFLVEKMQTFTLRRHLQNQC